MCAVPWQQRWTLDVLVLNDLRLCCAPASTQARCGGGGVEPVHVCPTCWGLCACAHYVGARARVLNMLGPVRVCSTCWGLCACAQHVGCSLARPQARKRAVVAAALEEGGEGTMANKLTMEVRA